LANPDFGQGEALRKRFIVYVTQGEDGAVDRVGIPMRYVYMFVAAAVVGMFSIAGMAGSYSRMLVKAESINRMRDELAMTRKDYAGLEKKAQAYACSRLPCPCIGCVGCGQGSAEGRFVHLYR
jgi:hypothetical protein